MGAPAAIVVSALLFPSLLSPAVVGLVSFIPPALVSLAGGGRVYYRSTGCLFVCFVFLRLS